jgi:hypothetical protein
MGFTSGSSFPSTNSRSRSRKIVGLGRSSRMGQEDKKDLRAKTRSDLPGRDSRKIVFSAESAVRVMKAANLSPLVPYPGSGKPWRCRCDKCKRIVTPRYNSVQQTGGGCRYCGAITRGKHRRNHDSKVTKEMRARFAKPLEPYVSAKSPWNCQCLKCKRAFQIRYDNARLTRVACPYCNGSRVDPSEIRQKLIRRGLLPVEPFPGTKTKWKVRCRKCNLTSSRRTDGKAALERPCPFCSRRRTHSQTALEILNQAGLDPLVNFPGANSPWKSRCRKCSRTVTPRLANIRRGQTACAYCSGHIVVPSKAHSVMRRAGLTPLTPYLSATAPWRCRCNTCRRVVKPRYNDIKNGQGGCFFCANRGFDFSKPAILYLLTHTRKQILKVGITGSKTKESRLATHTRYGWKVIATWERRHAIRVAEAEADVLNWWRQELRLKPAVTSTQMPQGGFTETVSMKLVKPRTVVVRVTRLLGAPDSVRN